MRIWLQLSLSKKDMKNIKQVEMGHNRNKISYICNMKEMWTKLKLRESGKYKRGRQEPKISFLSQICPSKPVGGEEESKERKRRKKEKKNKTKIQVCFCLGIMGNWILKVWYGE